MSQKDFLDWWPVLLVVLGWIVTATMQWTNLNNKIKQNAEDIREKASLEQLNGMGQRVEGIKNDCANQTGRMDRFEQEVRELRSLAQGASDKMTRVDKGVSDLSDTVRDGNISIGVQLGELNKSIHLMDKNLGNRMTRVETVQKIEQKIGPLPTEGA